MSFVALPYYAWNFDMLLTSLKSDLFNILINMFNPILRLYWVLLRLSVAIRCLGWVYAEFGNLFATKLKLADLFLSFRFSKVETSTEIFPSPLEYFFLKLFQPL